MSGPVFLTRAHRWRNGLPVFLTTAERDLNIVTPMQGEACYVDDNTAAEGLQTYSGTGWRPVSWNSAWGVIAQVSSTSDQTTITTDADIAFTTSSNTWTGVANRLYKVTLSIYTTQIGGAGGTQTMTVGTGASGALGVLLATEVITAIASGASASRGWTVNAFHTVTGSASVHARLSDSSGSATISNSVEKGWMVVEDVGPTGAAP